MPLLQPKAKPVTATASKGRAKRRYVIIPVIILGLIFAAYSVLWMQGAKLMKQSVADFVSDEQAAGHLVEMKRVRIKGYPFTLSAQIDDFTWSDPSEWSWSGEKLFIVTLPYDPSRLIFVPRGPQNVRVGTSSYDIIADTLRVGLEAGNFSAETQGLSTISEEGQLALGDLKANLIQNEDGTWILGAAVRDLVTTMQDRSPVTTHFWNIAASGDVATPQKATIDATELALSDGMTTPPAVVKLNGHIGIDHANYPEGKLNLSIRNYQILVELLEQQNLLSQDDLASIKPTLDAFANTGNDEIALPFTLRQGKLSMAGLPIADLPKIR
ncbi:MAG: DUF2125 domain-containing protein [Pseudomonadota bacterium]